jgi:hypothetical protein
MTNYRFAEMPSNEAVASLTTFVVSAWFLVAGAALLTEPSVGQQARALAAKTPTVTVRQLSARENVQPDVRFTVEVAARRTPGRVS